MKTRVLVLGPLAEFLRRFAADFSYIGVPGRTVDRVDAQLPQLVNNILGPAHKSLA